MSDSGYVSTRHGKQIPLSKHAISPNLLPWSAANSYSAESIVPAIQSGSGIDSRVSFCRSWWVHPAKILCSGPLDWQERPLVSMGIQARRHRVLACQFQYLTVGRPSGHDPFGTTFSPDSRYPPGIRSNFIEPDLRGRAHHNAASVRMTASFIIHYLSWQTQNVGVSAGIGLYAT